MCINPSLPIHPMPSFLPWYPYIHMQPFSASSSLFLLCKKVHQYHFSKFQKWYDNNVFLFLTSLTLTVSRFIHVSAGCTVLFLFVAEIPSCIGTASSLSILLLMGCLSVWEFSPVSFLLPFSFASVNFGQRIYSDWCLSFEIWNLFYG